MIEIPKISDPTVESKALFTLLRRQAEALERMKLLVQKQRQAVVQDNPEALLALLKQRQVVVEALVRMGSEIKRVRREWEQQRDSLAPNDRAQVSRLIDEMTQTFEEIMDADAQDVRALAAKKQLIGHALQETHATAHAMTAYTSGVPKSHGAMRLDEAS